MRGAPGCPGLKEGVAFFFVGSLSDKTSHVWERRLTLRDMWTEPKCHNFIMIPAVSIVSEPKLMMVERICDGNSAPPEKTETKQNKRNTKNKTSVRVSASENPKKNTELGELKVCSHTVVPLLYEYARPDVNQGWRINSIFFHSFLLSLVPLASLAPLTTNVRASEVPSSMFKKRAKARTIAELARSFSGTAKDPHKREQYR